jgi:hypothetical protein
MIRQRPDGSWANRFTDGKEDDPLIATPLALLALVNCRDATSNRTGAAGGTPPRGETRAGLHPASHVVNNCIKISYGTNPQ